MKTSYNDRTPESLSKVLERLRQDRTRVTVKYKWGEEKSGYISRSTGSVKIPLLVYNTRAWGGEGLLTHCIVEIRHSNKRRGGVIWRLREILCPHCKAPTRETVDRELRRCGDARCGAMISTK